MFYFTVLRFFLIIFIFNIDYICGCSCAPEYPLRSSYADAVNIFDGKILKVQKYKNLNRLEVQFNVDSKFKGTFSSSNKINVSTPLLEASCGLPMKVGQEWQVWAIFESYDYFSDSNITDSEENVFLSTNRCLLTTRELYRNIEFLLDPPTNSTDEPEY